MLSILGIIKCVTLTTLYMNSMWWPPNRSIDGFLNQSVFLILSSLTAFTYVMGTICGPGFLPLRWEPSVSNFNLFNKFHSSIDILFSIG